MLWPQAVKHGQLFLFLASSAWHLCIWPKEHLIVEMLCSVAWALNYCVLCVAGSLVILALVLMWAVSAEICQESVLEHIILTLTELNEGGIVWVCWCVWISKRYCLSQASSFTQNDQTCSHSFLSSTCAWIALEGLK